MRSPHATPATGRATRPARRRLLAAALGAALAGLVGSLVVAFGASAGVVGASVPRGPVDARADVRAEGSVVASPTPDAEGPTDRSVAWADVPVLEAGLRAPAAVVPPVRIVVDELADVRVRPVGVDPDGSMELPRSGQVAGWYRFGAAPGDEDGTVVVAAHVDTSAGVGAFAALQDARRGTTVRVMTKDGTRHGYRVTDVRRYDKRVLPLAELFDRTGDARLVLITCGGRWDPVARSYEDNLVVSAVPDAFGDADR